MSLKSGKLYSYMHDEELKMGVLETFFPVRDKKWVALDNGDKFPLDVFESISSLVEESDQHFDTIQSNTNVDSVQESNVNMPQLKFDKDGFPILEGVEKPNSNPLGDIQHMIDNHPDIVQPTAPTPAQSKPTPQVVAPPVVSDPVIEVIKRAKTDKTPMQLDIEVDLYDKDLITILVKSFGEDSMEKLVDHMIENLDIQSIKEKITEKLCIHYDIEMKSVPTDNEENDGE